MLARKNILCRSCWRQRMWAQVVFPAPFRARKRRDMSTRKNESDIPQSPAEIDLAARQLLSQLPATNISIETEQAYRKELSRLIVKTRSPDQPESPDRFWAALCDTSSKRTYYRRVAAVKFGLRIMLERALRSERADTLRFVIGLSTKVKEAHGTCPIESPTRRHSKRQDIRGLPADWRETMLSEMKTTPHHLPFLVLAVVGCRAEELKKGVRVVATRSALTLNIQGAKVKETQGQPTRQVTYEIIDANTHPLVQALHRETWSESIIDEDSREVLIRIVGEKSGFSSAIRRAGHRLWPRRRSEITPSCFRHAAASDFKEHLAADEVSAAIGHCVDATKSRYGQRQMSSGNSGLQPSSVKAERVIRVTSQKNWRPKLNQTPLP